MRTSTGPSRAMPSTPPDNHSAMPAIAAVTIEIDEGLDRAILAAMLPLLETEGLRN